jgi:uncharacterized membrane protein YedE/YeeE
VGFLISLVAGTLFGLGLLVSRMCDPQRVLGFLDVGGQWNPALAFTMAGAILVAAPAFFWVRRHGSNLRKQPVKLPNRFTIDKSLVGGGAIFGVGWGLSGICPGPALLLLTAGTLPSIIFIAGLIAGMVLQRLLPIRRIAAPHPDTTS